MTEVCIDCSEIVTREDLHRIFARELSFPAWYGKNLDALHDCLTSHSGTIRLENWEEAQQRLGKYGLSAKKAIAAAGLENENLIIIL